MILYTNKIQSNFLCAIWCSFLLIFFASTNASSQNRNDLNRIYKTATNLERLGHYDRAVENYFKLFQALPASASYYNGLKRNLLRLGRYEELVDVVRQRLRVVDDIVGRADLGDALYKNQREEEARKIWDDLLVRYKSSSGAYSQVAAAMLRNSLTDDAVEIYKNGRAVLNNPSLFAIELANAYAARLQYDLATREFLQYLNRNPKQLAYTQQRILSLFNEDSGPGILQEVENYIQNHAPPSFELLQIKANCLKKLRRFQEALSVHAQLETLKPANKKNRPNGRELFNFANEMQRIGQLEVAISAYRELIAYWPKSPYFPAAQIGLAEALVQSGSYDDAIASLDAMIKAKKNPNYVLRAYLLKGDIYLTHLNRPEQALQVYETVQKSFSRPDAQKESAIALGDVHFRLGDHDRAKEWYLHAFRLFSTKEIGYRNKVHLKLADLAFCNREFKEAIAILEKVEQVANARPQENDLYNDALESIILIEQNLSDSTSALALYAQSKCMQKRRELAVAADSLEVLVRTYPQSLLAPKSLLDLGAIYGFLKQPEKKVAAYSRAATEYAASIYADEATFRLAQAYEEAGKIEDAIGTYEKLLQDFPMSIYLEETRQRIRTLRDGAAVQ